MRKGYILHNTLRGVYSSSFDSAESGTIEENLQNTKYFRIHYDKLCKALSHSDAYTTANEVIDAFIAQIVDIYGDSNIVCDFSTWDKITSADERIEAFRTAKDNEVEKYLAHSKLFKIWRHNRDYVYEECFLRPPKVLPTDIYVLICQTLNMVENTVEVFCESSPAQACAVIEDILHFLGSDESAATEDTRPSALRYITKETRSFLLVWMMKTYPLHTIDIVMTKARRTSRGASNNEILFAQITDAKAQGEIIKCICQALCDLASKQDPAVLSPEKGANDLAQSVDGAAEDMDMNMRSQIKMCTRLLSRLLMQTPMYNKNLGVMLDTVLDLRPLLRQVYMFLASLGSYQQPTSPGSVLYLKTEEDRLLPDFLKTHCDVDKERGTKQPKTQLLAILGSEDKLNCGDAVRGVIIQMKQEEEQRRALEEARRKEEEQAKNTPGYIWEHSQRLLAQLPSCSDRKKKLLFTQLVQLFLGAWDNVVADECKLNKKRGAPKLPVAQDDSSTTSTSPMEQAASELHRAIRRHMTAFPTHMQRYNVALILNHILNPASNGNNNDRIAATGTSRRSKQDISGMGDEEGIDNALLSLYLQITFQGTGTTGGDDAREFHSLATSFCNRLVVSEPMDSSFQPSLPSLSPQSLSQQVSPLMLFLWNPVSFLASLVAQAVSSAKQQESVLAVLREMDIAHKIIVPLVPQGRLVSIISLAVMDFLGRTSKESQAEPVVNFLLALHNGGLIEDLFGSLIYPHVYSLAMLNDDRLAATLLPPSLPDHHTAASTNKKNREELVLYVLLRVAQELFSSAILPPVGGTDFAPTPSPPHPRGAVTTFDLLYCLCRLYEYRTHLLFKLRDASFSVLEVLIADIDAVVQYIIMNTSEGVVSSNKKPSREEIDHLLSAQARRFGMKFGILPLLRLHRLFGKQLLHHVSVSEPKHAAMRKNFHIELAVLAAASSASLSQYNNLIEDLRCQGHTAAMKSTRTTTTSASVSSTMVDIVPVLLCLARTLPCMTQAEIQSVATYFIATIASKHHQGDPPVKAWVSVGYMLLQSVMCVIRDVRVTWPQLEERPSLMNAILSQLFHRNSVPGRAVPISVGPLISSVIHSIWVIYENHLPTATATATATSTTSTVDDNDKIYYLSRIFRMACELFYIARQQQQEGTVSDTTPTAAVIGEQQMDHIFIFMLKLLEELVPLIRQQQTTATTSTSGIYSRIMDEYVVQSCERYLAQDPQRRSVLLAMAAMAAEAKQ